MPPAFHRLRRALPLVTAAALASLVSVVQPLPTAAAATSVPRPLGIDVSRWQSAGPDDTCAASGIDWAKVRSSSRTFVLIRATRTHSGVTDRDVCFSRNWAGARARGIYRGAYHYAIPSARAGSATRDARAFVAVTGRMQDAGDLPPVLDLETSGGLAPAQLASWAATWLKTVRSLTGRQPMIYTYPSFWRGAMADSRAFHAYPLWIAHWVRTPSVPGGWPTWTIHQYSSTGRVSGIAGDVDLNEFHGTAAQLHAFAHPGTRALTDTTGSIAYRGSPWRISGRLVTDRRASVSGATVRLYRSTSGGAWRAVATTRTTSSGAYRFVLRPQSAAQYKIRYAGSTSFAPTWSSVRSHSIRNRVGTRLTESLSSTEVRRGATLRVSGSLLRTDRPAKLARRTVTLYQRVGGGAWTRVRAMHTSSRGWYSFAVRPTRSVAYQVRFGGSFGTLPAVASHRWVRVR